jgi:hypothetical protein
LEVSWARRSVMSAQPPTDAQVRDLFREQPCVVAVQEVLRNGRRRLGLPEEYGVADWQIVRHESSSVTEHETMLLGTPWTELVADLERVVGVRDPVLWSAVEEKDGEITGAARDLLDQLLVRNSRPAILTESCSRLAHDWADPSAVAALSWRFLQRARGSFCEQSGGREKHRHSVRRPGTGWCYVLRCVRRVLGIQNLIALAITTTMESGS